MAGLFRQGEKPVAAWFGSQPVSAIYFGHLKMWPMAEVESAAMPFYLVGRPVDLIRSLFLRTQTRNFALVGNEGNIFSGAYVECLTGQFALDGKAVALRRGVTMVTDAAAFVLDGADISLTRDLILHVDHGAFDLVGNAADPTRDKRLSADPIAFTLTGYAAGWLQAEVMTASTGVFVQLRVPANLRRSLRVQMATGEFELVGQDADFIQRSMSAEPANFDLTGYSVIMNAGVRMLGETGTFALGVEEAGLRRDLVIGLDAGAIALTGYAAGTLRGFVVTADAGSISLTGNAIDLFTYDLRILAGDEAGNIRVLAGDEAGNRRRI